LTSAYGCAIIVLSTEERHMGTDVVATPEQVNTALRAIMTQLSTTGIADGFDSMAQALEELNMWEFVLNQARVVAQLQAFSVRDNNIINKLTMSGAFKTESSNAFDEPGDNTAKTHPWGAAAKW
jgi:hypothetical protein